ncbi:MAG TPA: 2OG-Fe(II) oxygenase [Thermoanaerobaculia bacterium]|nr:2OG-Fe(II) oxygenase [Thermoanaerobaculia bacterium]
MKWRWEPGRQGTGYRKMRIAGGASWDLHLLDYPPGASVPRHVDPVPGKAHVRCNLRLLGEDAFVGRALLKVGRLVVFRSDKPHAVRTVTRRRVALSLGLAL